MRLPRPLPSFLLALLLLGHAGAPARAQALQPLAAIRQAAITALAAGEGAEARLAPGLRLAACTQPLVAAPSGQATAEVRCPDTPGWRLFVPVRPAPTGRAVVLAAPAAAGEPLQAAQLRVEPRRGNNAGWFDDPAALVGRVPARPLPAGTVLTAALLRQTSRTAPAPMASGTVAAAPAVAPMSAVDTGMMVQRGDPVVLRASFGGTEVRMAGKALGRALPGAVLNVENSSSHRIVRGRLDADGTVEVLN